MKENMKVLVWSAFAFAAGMLIYKGIEYGINKATKLAAGKTTTPSTTTTV